MKGAVFCKKWIVLAVIPAVMMLYYNQKANWHFHILSNGMVVEHAHPFKKHHTPGTPFQSHHHTDLELSILAQLSNLAAMTVLVLAMLGMLLQRTSFNFASPFALFYPGVDLSMGLLRAPPASSR